MALTFPAAVTAIADHIPLASASWNLARQQQHSNIGAGVIMSAARGADLWEADCTSLERPHAEVRVMRARLDSLVGGLNAFYLYDPAAVAPALDPTGSILGANTPQVHTVTPKTLTVKGLPAGYVLSIGDMIAVDFDGRRWLGQILEAATADGSGITPAFTIDPALPAGVAANDAVYLLKASAMMKIIPGSMRLSATTSHTSVLMWKARQTYQAA